MSMTPRRLAEIRERAEQATAGPWYLVNDNQIHDRETKFNEYGVRIGETPNLIAVEKWPNGPANTQFIAHSRQDIPELLEYIEELQGAAKHLIHSCEERHDSETAERFTVCTDGALNKLIRLIGGSGE